MHRTPPSRWAHRRPRGLCALAYFCASASLLSLPSRAQDAQPDSQSIAEAARQEKARKAAQQKKDSHVYTSEDLKQSQILAPQDRDRIEARKNSSPTTPAAPADPSVGAEKISGPESLGEIARRYRREQLEISQAAEAAKQQPASRFPLELAQPSFAAPVKPAARFVFPNSHPRQTVKPVQRISPSRRDPFSRQTFAPPLSNGRAPLSPDFSAPAKPSISFADAAPRAPAVHAAPHAAAPNLLLSAKPLPANPTPAPRAAPVAPVLTSPCSSKQILIQPGDSLWKLARRHLGNGSRWNDLLAANPSISDPLRLPSGAVLVVPGTDLRSRLQPSSVTIQSGDSLWKIAASQLGSGAAWPCLAQANPQLRNANLLRPGQLLTIPVSCPIQPKP